jgi:hypothetical protein
VGAEGRVEPLDVGGADDGAGRRRRQDGLDAGLGTVDDPARDPDDVPFGRVLDDLGEREPVGQDQPRATAPPGADRLPEDLPEGGDVAGQAASTQTRMAGVAAQARTRWTSRVIRGRSR